MNQIDTAPDELPRLVVEYEVPGIDEGVHGITFDSRHLVVASGARLVRLVPATGRVIDQLETFPRAGGLAFDGRHLWQHVDGRFEQLEVRTGLAVRSVAVDLDDDSGHESIEGDLLVLHAGGRLLARVELVDHAEGVEAIVVADLPTDAPLRGLAWSRGELWTRPRPGSSSSHRSGLGAGLRASGVCPPGCGSATSPETPTRASGASTATAARASGFEKRPPT